MTLKYKIYLLLLHLTISFALFIAIYILDFKFNELYIFSQKNSYLLFDFKEFQFLKLTIVLLLFGIVWTFFLGIGVPLFFIFSYFYDPIIGTILLVLSKSIGSTLMYFFLNKFFYKDINKYLKKKKILNKKIYEFIHKNEFFFFVIIRTVPIIPYQLTDILPIIFNMKIHLYFFFKIYRFNDF